MVEESIEIMRSTAPIAAVEVEVQPGRAIGPKILLYSHDTFGLGNIHRTLRSFLWASSRAVELHPRRHAPQRSKGGSAAESKRRPLTGFPPLTRTSLPISFRQGGVSS